MAAAGSGWITVVVCNGRLTLAFSLLLVLLAGLPHKGDSSIPVVKSKSPSAEECRQHVDKAVDQYFGSKSGDQVSTKDDSSTHIQTPPTDTKEDDDDDSKDDKNPPITISDKNQAKENDDDADNDDDEGQIEDLARKESDDGDREEHTDEAKDKIVDDNDDDDDDDDGDEDDDDEDEEDDAGVNQTVKIDANVVEDDDDEDEDEDEDEINDLNENLNDNADDEDDDDTDNEVVTKDNITKASDHRTVDNIKHQHREARSTKVEPDDDDDDKEEKEDEEDDNTEDEEDDDDDEDTDKEEADEDDDENGDDDDEDEKKEEKEPTTTIPKLQTTQYETKPTTTIPKIQSTPEEEKPTTTIPKIQSTPEVEKKPTTNIPKIQSTPEEKKPTTNIPKIQITRSETPEKELRETDSEKATGGPDPTPTRVAQELPRGQPPTQQPQTQEVPKEAQTVIKSPAGGTNQTQEANKTIPITENEDDDDDDDEEDEDDDLIENIYEEEEDDDDDDSAGLTFRSRAHVDAILNLDHIGTEYDQDEEKLAQPIYRDIKKIHAASIKPMEVLYKYTDSTSRLLGDAEIFNKPMILFIGPWNTGKTAIINYLLGIERTPAAFKTGTGITDVDFTVITHGDKRQTISGTELTVDWKYASLQRFGQRFLDHFKAVTVPHTLLKKINIVDTPGILENRKNLERGYPFNDAFQWFIDRADAIYVVLDPTKIDVGAELGAVVDQLKGREVRFILDKADTIRRSDLMKVVGQLFWNLSPLMGSSEAPVIYAVSLSSKPFNPTAPAKFLADQENNFLFDLKDTMSKRVENRILYARRHAVRVRNHAKMVDCYLATYYRHKSIFSNKKNVAKQIVENPADYHIYEGLGNLSNVSRYDIPDESTFKNFFRLHSLYDFRPLASTCSYFRGCPMDKLDAAISSELPELLSKYKKAKNASSSHVKQEGR